MRNLRKDKIISIASTILLCQLIIIESCFAQKAEIDINLLRLDELEFYSNKEAIAEKFGKPKKVRKADDQCGYRTVELSYKNFAFVGNDTEDYWLESIKFNKKSNLILNYGKYNFSHKLTKDEFIKIFGLNINADFENRSNGKADILLYFEGADDGLIFSFKTGHLTKIDYWSLCEI